MTDTPNQMTAENGLALPGLAAPAAPYRVLARKYRPQNFDDLIGQDAMVRTLRNAFSSGRIPQAWILTGVRGVGKTTTARILARGLNYALQDGTGGPTVDLKDEGIHCRAIMESRHVDVLEMDAASHTGIDDVKQITDGVRYAPASARYKVYIIDEVHMLSEKAFNAFLKTLEEPPPHAKFVFATTEIRKVPVTILSRCQRFDLRRVEGTVLSGHLRRICNAEGVAIEDEALAMIARAAEGSVRDSLSLLDQAIAHGAGAVDAETVRTMLGLADRGRIIDLFAHLVGGDLPAALNEFRDQYDSGADPVQILSELAEFSHFVTRLKAVPTLADDASVSEVERRRGLELSALSMKTLSRFWQMLLKGIAETKDAPKPVAAAEMALVRMAYAADLPPLDEVLKGLSHGGGSSGAGVSRPAPSGGGTRAQASNLALASRSETIIAPRTEREPGIALARFEDLVALAHEKRDIAMKIALERDVRLVRFEDGRLEFNAARGASPHLAQDLSKRLNEWTGKRWVVALSSDEGAPTLKEVADAQKAETLTGVRADPLVRAVLEKFPSAEIVAVRDLTLEAATAAPIEADEGGDEAISFDFNRLEQDD